VLPDAAGQRHGAVLDVDLERLRQRAEDRPVDRLLHGLHRAFAQGLLLLERELDAAGLCHEPAAHHTVAALELHQHRDLLLRRAAHRGQRERQRRRAPARPPWPSTFDVAAQPLLHLAQALLGALLDRAFSERGEACAR
jgi:hypothetical protein